MATLEKIRSKSVLLIAVIGVALLAFVIGDFFTSGRTFFGNDRAVATVGGTKIDVQDFQRRYEQASAQYQQRNQNVDYAVIQQQVLDGMISEALMNEAIEELGIAVTSEELSNAMVGAGATPQMIQIAQSMGAATPAQLHDMIFNPDNYGIPAEQANQLRAYWLDMENRTEEQLKYMKYSNLVSGAIQANNLDKAEINNSNAISHIAVVKKDYSTLKDSDFEVTDADLKAEYAKNKEKYKSEQETRRAYYIAVDIKPSASDEMAAQKLFEGAVADLKANKGVEGVVSNSELMVKENTVTLASEKNPKIKEFLQGASVEDVTEVSHIGDTYSITKLVAAKVETDSVLVTIAQVQGNAQMQDSVLNLLNTTGIASVEKMENVSVQQDMWMNLTEISPAEQDVKGKLLNAGSDYFVVNSAAEGAIIAKVVEKKAPKQMYEIAEVSYKVLPSATTTQDLRDALQAYVAENNTTENFVSKAVPSGYQAIEVMVSPDMPQLNRLANTRKGIQWIFGADKGSVSPVFDKDSKDKMFAFAVEDIIPAGYAPYTDKMISEQLKNEVIRNKKGDKLIADYKGKANDIAGYASAMSVAVDTTTSNFAQPFIAVIGYEPTLAGSIAGATAGKVSGPVKGNNAVFVYQVSNVDAEGPKLSDEQASNRFAQTMGSMVVERNLVNILRQNSKVSNDLIKFF